MFLKENHHKITAAWNECVDCEYTGGGQGSRLHDMKTQGILK